MLRWKYCHQIRLAINDKKISQFVYFTIWCNKPITFLAISKGAPN